MISPGRCKWFSVILILVILSASLALPRAANTQPVILLSRTHRPALPVGDVSGVGEVPQEASSTSCPITCSPGSVRITTQVGASNAVEATFCENGGAGIGDLWIINHSTAGHIVRFIPPSNRNDVATKKVFTWGPDYCFKLAPGLIVRPGDRFGIEASRFGSSASDNISATNAHLSLMNEILFAGDTPLPDLTKAEAAYRYGEVLCSALGDLDACDMDLLLKAYKVLKEGNASSVVDLLLGLASSDKGLNAVTRTLGRMGKVVAKESLKLLLPGHYYHQEHWWQYYQPRSLRVGNLRSQAGSLHFCLGAIQLYRAASCTAM